MRESTMGKGSERPLIGQSLVIPILRVFILVSLLVLGCGPSGAASERGRAASTDTGAPPLVGDTSFLRPTDTSPWVPSEGTELRLEVRAGADRLLEEFAHLVEGKRVGLITNHTGLARGGESTIDLLHSAPGVDLVALFSPEHGIRGSAEAGERVASGVDEATGLPIHSLYGETRSPTPEMLDGLEILIFDIQDIGTRYYTYIWTMALALQAAAENGLGFVVLDRPNPIGGHLVQGNVLEPAQASFVGLYPVPMRHGMTVGEMAHLLVGEYGIDVELEVVPVEGWRRGDWFDQTGLNWVAPSPNMPSLESALHYPGSCLFEGTNLSVGRGTELAFQQIGAPWLDHEELVQRLEGYELAGVRFEPVVFSPENPGDGKFEGEEVRGIRLISTDREVYDPTLAAVALLLEIRRLHPEELGWRAAHFDRLAGTERLRRQIIEGRDLEEIRIRWERELEHFGAIRARYLLYR